MSDQLKKRIKSKRARIAVIGLGYVGLPLLVNFAKKDFPVIGLETDQDRLDKVKRSVSYILDVPSRTLKLLNKKKRIFVTNEFEQLQSVDVVIICVPTPLKRKYTPDITYLLEAVQAVRRNLQKDQLVICESTTYPGTTGELIKPELEKSGLVAEKNLYLAFSPERIDPGNKTYGLTKITKIVGGIGPKSGELTRLLYEKIIKKVHVVSSARSAEMAKLLENSFRIINIGWINEVAMMCHQMGIDVWEVIEAAKTKPFGYMPFYPGLGVGGHCIPDDPLYLFWKARAQGFNSRFIKLSADVNSHMPVYVAGRIKDILIERNKPIREARILIVGVTYKKNVKDLRKSPSIKLMEILQALCHRVDYYDSHIPFLKFANLDMVSVEPTFKTWGQYDCVVIAVDHSKTNYGMIKKHARLIFDIRNVYKRVNHPKIIKL